MSDLGNGTTNHYLVYHVNTVKLRTICKNEPKPKLKGFWCHFENVRLMFFFKNEQLNTW